MTDKGPLVQFRLGRKTPLDIQVLAWVESERQTDEFGVQESLGVAAKRLLKRYYLVLADEGQVTPEV